LDVGVLKQDKMDVFCTHSKSAHIAVRIDGGQIGKKAFRRPIGSSCQMTLLFVRVLLFR